MFGKGGISGMCDDFSKENPEQMKAFFNKMRLIVANIQNGVEGNWARKGDKIWEKLREEWEIRDVGEQAAAIETSILELRFFTRFEKMGNIVRVGESCLGGTE
jgi:hypothetical protein